MAVFGGPADEPVTIGPTEGIKCDRFYGGKDVNHTYLIYGGYEGIPQNLLINVIVWLVGFTAMNIW